MQADALADLLAEMATKSDIRELRSDFRRLEQMMDVRFTAVDQTIDLRFRAFEETIDLRIRAFEQIFDSRLTSIEKGWNANLAKMEARLNWRLIALVTLLGIVMAMGTSAFPPHAVPGQLPRGDPLVQTYGQPRRARSIPGQLPLGDPLVQTYGQVQTPFNGTVFPVKS